MRAERGGGGGSKSSGFFNLFDWNRKSRKKLFTVSPEGSKIGRRLEESLPSTRLHMMDTEEDESAIEFSCAASSISSDDLLNGSKPAGVVARLMGLDSLPTSDSNSFRESPLNNYPLTRNPIRKLPSSPIERFQMEPIRSRTLKPSTLSSNYHKMLLSPIKNPNFAYGRNANQIMEAAAKILEPRPEYNNVSSISRREKVCSVGTGQIDPLRVSESVRNEKAASRLLQMSRVERGSNNNSIKEEDIVIMRPSHESNINIKNLGNSNTSGLNTNKGNKGKSVSLAVQAKVNVQKREGVNLSKTNNRDSCDSVDTSHPRTGTNKQQKKVGTSSGSTSPVLRQNNQKQNCVGNRAGKSKSTVNSQQGRKNVENSSSKQKSRLKPRKENNNFDLLNNSNESERKENNFDFPQKKRLIERNNNNNDKNKNKNRNKNNVLVDEYSKWNEESKDTTDIVSFTFTSPLMKQNAELSSLSSPLVKQLGLIPVKGNKDALSLLLENKLRELGDNTRNERKSVDFGKNIDFGESELGFRFDDAIEEQREKKKKACAGGIFDFSVMEKGECSKMSDMLYEDEEMKQLSPFTVFGEESCSTSETSIDGTKIVSPSSVQAQYTISSSKAISTETTDSISQSNNLLDISSSFIPSEQLDASSRFVYSSPEQDYITYVIHNMDLENLELDSPLFDKLERKRSRNTLERTELEKTDRKLVYDCVRECLDSKLEERNNGIGMGIGGNKGIAEREVKKEIEGWRKMREMDVDEIVERDMVVKRDYRVDKMEICADLEVEIFDELIDDVIGAVMGF